MTPAWPLLRFRGLTVGVEGWEGWHGEGKTYVAVETTCTRHVDALRAWERNGRPGPAPELWSNVPIRGARTFSTWDQLVEGLDFAAANMLRVIVLVDELGTWAPARMWSKMDPRVLTWLQQRRRYGAGTDLYWTAPSVDHVDSMVRGVTQVLHRVKRIGGTEYSHEGGRPPRAFFVRSYDPRQAAKASAKPRGRRLVPFSRPLADLYLTQTVDLDGAMAHSILERPDYFGPADAHEPAREVALTLTVDLATQARPAGPLVSRWVWVSMAGALAWEVAGHGAAGRTAAFVVREALRAIT